MPVELISQTDAPEEAIQILVINSEGLDEAWALMSEIERGWLTQNDFAAKPGQVCLLPSSSGEVSRVLFGIPKEGTERSSLQFAKLTKSLPAGTYYFSQPPQSESLVALSWLLEAYKFTRYTGNDEGNSIRLIVADDQDACLRTATACSD